MRELQAVLLAAITLPTNCSLQRISPWSKVPVIEKALLITGTVICIDVKTLKVRRVSFATFVNVLLTVQFRVCMNYKVLKTVFEVEFFFTPAIFQSICPPKAILVADLG